MDLSNKDYLLTNNLNSDFCAKTNDYDYEYVDDEDIDTEL